MGARRASAAIVTCVLVTGGMARLPGRAATHHAGPCANGKSELLVQKRGKLFFSFFMVSLLTSPDVSDLLFNVTCLGHGGPQGVIVGPQGARGQAHDCTHLTVLISPRPHSQARSQLGQRVAADAGGDRWGRWPEAHPREREAAGTVA